MFLCRIALWVLVLVNARQIVCSSENPIVDLGYAKYQGTFNSTSGVSTFLGIRYASAPTGNWRPLYTTYESLIP